MSDKIQIGGSGISFMGLLFVVFLILKLGVGGTAVMGWSWWWVCAPLWMPMAIGISIMFVLLIIAAICLGIKAAFSG